MYRKCRTDHQICDHTSGNSQTERESVECDTRSTAGHVSISHSNRVKAAAVTSKELSSSYGTNTERRATLKRTQRGHKIDRLRRFKPRAASLMVVH